MIPFILISVMIPVNLKFEPEKGRVVMLIVAGIVIGGYYVLREYIPTAIVEAFAFWEKINLSDLQLGVLIAAVLWVISMSISVKVLYNKEY